MRIVETMTEIEIGTICFKTVGRSAGQKVVVVEAVSDSGKKDGFVFVEGESVKRKRCNPRHLFVTSQKVKIHKGATHADIVSALKE